MTVPVTTASEFASWHLIRPTWRHASTIADWALAQVPSVLGPAAAHPFAVTVVSSWWNRPGVQPLLLVDEVGEPVAYGEVWDNPEQDESELAHLLINPQRHSAGIYGCLVDGLVDRARVNGRSRCLVRVPHGSDEVVKTSRNVGFQDVDEETVMTWNREQPRSYHWLEHPDFPGAVAQ